MIIIYHVRMQTYLLLLQKAAALAGQQADPRSSALCGTRPLTPPPPPPPFPPPPPSLFRPPPALSTPREDCGAELYPQGLEVEGHSGGVEPGVQGGSSEGWGP